MEFLLHTLEHTIQDTWTMFPLLLVTYLILELIERRGTNQDEKIFLSLQKYGPVLGALVGLIPQCGFSILGAMLYLQRNISLGTLIALFIATSDEAIPILLSEPDLYSTLGDLLICKFVLAIVVGWIVDHVLYRNQKIMMLEKVEDDEEDEEDSISSCPCCYVQYPFYISALLRSLKIYVFLFLTSLVLTILVDWISSDTLSMLLLSNSIFQPILSGIFGFIPNCAATVILSSLYVGGQLSFGALLSGLVTNSGLGLAVLLRYSEKRGLILKVVAILLFSAILSGMCISFIWR